MKKIICFICIAAAAVFPFAACAGGISDPLKLDIPVYAADGPRMDIAAYHAPSPSFSEQKDFDDIAALGLNIIVPEAHAYNFSENPAGKIVLLDRMQQAGLQVILQDKDLQHNLLPASPNTWNTKNLHHYITHPAVYGVDIRDEPHAAEIPGLRLLHEKWNAEVEAGNIPKDKVFFVNLALEMDIGKQDNLDKYMEEVRPPLLSYDFYAPHHAAVGDPQSDLVSKTGFFAFIDQAANTARRYSQEWGREVPLNVIMLGAGHRVGGHIRYKNIDQTDLRWQIGAAMSFGVKFISFYNYSHITDGVFEEMLQHVLNPSTGEKTELYYDMQAVLQELRKWDRVFMNFNRLDTAMVPGSHGMMNLMLSMTRNTIDPEELDGIKSIVSTQDAFVGAFEDADGRKGYMAYNASLPWDEKNATVTVTFDNKKYRAVQVYEKGEPVIKPVNKQTVALRLRPGESQFFIPLEKK